MPGSSPRASRARLQDPSPLPRRASPRGRTSPGCCRPRAPRHESMLPSPHFTS
jgi:hypothetical protein